jgi:hypothetical protein
MAAAVRSVAVIIISIVVTGTDAPIFCNHKRQRAGFPSHRLRHRDTEADDALLNPTLGA